MKRLVLLFGAYAVLSFLFVPIYQTEAIETSATEPAPAAFADDLHGIDIITEPPAITGPAPAFKDRILAKRLAKDVYFAAQYPQFGISFIDEDIERQVKAQFSVFLRVGKIMDTFKYSLNYDIYASKPGIVSVVLVTSMENGGYRGYYGRVARTYDLSRHKVLQFGDIFPNWIKSRRKLLAITKEDNTDDCQPPNFAMYKHFKNFYLVPTSVEEKGRIPELIVGLVVELISKPQGMPANPCEAQFDITQKELQEAGADMRYWGN